MPRAVKQWTERDAKCPFYQRATRQEIVCEGFERGQNVTLGWRGGKGKTRHMQEYCCKSFEKCEIYRALSALWED